MTVPSHSPGLVGRPFRICVWFNAGMGAAAATETAPARTRARSMLDGRLVCGKAVPSCSSALAEKFLQLFELFVHAQGFTFFEGSRPGCSHAQLQHARTTVS